MAAVPVRPPRCKNSARIVQIMAKHPEICCFVVAALLTFFSRYAKSTSKIITTGQPHPRPFFTSVSSVLDYPNGDLVDAAGILSEAETIFVFYYAPWDAKSKESRVEFEKAATYMQFQVPFVAVNCWYPRGVCKSQNNFLSFPVLIFYHTTLDGFRYTGIITAELLVRFVQKLLYPFTPVSTEEQIKSLLTTADHALVGYFGFNTSPQPPGFLQFYYAAMRLVEKYQENIVSVGIIVGQDLANSWSISDAPSAFLMSARNSTKSYLSCSNFTASAIVKWFSESKSAPTVSWLSPTGLKSLNLFNAFSNGPAFLLFTPHFPISHYNQYFYTLREVALDYYNCDNSSHLTHMVESSVKLRWKSFLTHVDLLERCRQRASKNVKKSTKTVARLPCCVSVLVRSTNQRTAICDVCLTESSYHSRQGGSCGLLHLVTVPLNTLPSGLNNRVCTHLVQGNDPTQVFDTCCRDNTSDSYLDHHVTSPLMKSDQDLHPDDYIRSIVNHGTEIECFNVMLKRRYGWMPVVNLPGSSVTDRKCAQLMGQGCLTNRTLEFYAMNSRYLSPFLERLGIKKHSQNNTVALIVNKENEVLFLMEEEFTKVHIGKFIKNFTSSSHERHLVSVDIEQSDCTSEGNRLCVQELSTTSFSQVVMQEDKDVVVLYYSHWCGFCSSFSHIYLTLSAYFQSSPNIVFTRLNGYRHELPWEYTVDSYPTLVFFPAYRKDNSITFPDHVPKTLPNLIHFLLKYAHRPLRLKKGLSICGKVCIRHNRQSTAKRIRELYHDIQTINQRISQVERHQKQIALLQPGESQRSAFLGHYVDVLQQRIKFKRMKVHSARRLYGVLLKSDGHMLQQHQVAAILDRLEVQQAKLDRLNLGTLPVEEYELNEEYGDGMEEETEQIVHDEL